MSMRFKYEAGEALLVRRFGEPMRIGKYVETVCDSGYQVPLAEYVDKDGNRQRIKPWFSEVVSRRELEELKSEAAELKTRADEIEAAWKEVISYY